MSMTGGMSGPVLDGLCWYSLRIQRLPATSFSAERPTVRQPLRMCTSARSKASSDVSGGGKNEAPGTCAQPAHAAHAIQNFQYYAGPTGHIAFWNGGPKIPTNQPEPANCKKLMASRRSRGRAFSHVGRYHPLLNSQLRQLLRRQFRPCGFLQHKAQSRILLYEGCHDFPS